MANINKFMKIRWKICNLHRLNHISAYTWELYLNLSNISFRHFIYIDKGFLSTCVYMELHPNINRFASLFSMGPVHGPISSRSVEFPTLLWSQEIDEQTTIHKSNQSDSKPNGTKAQNYISQYHSGGVGNTYKNNFSKPDFLKFYLDSRRSTT